MVAVGTCCCTMSPCCECSSYPNQYTVMVSGVTNGSGCTASDCSSALNGTILLTQFTSDPSCQWRSAFHSLCERGDVAYLLACQSSRQVWQLINGCDLSTCVAVYEVPAVSWSCLGTNTLTLVSTLTICTGWPSSLIVVPG